MAGQVTTFEGKLVQDTTGIDPFNVKMYDMYAALLNFKRYMTVLKKPAINCSWLPSRFQRRARAYDLLTAYHENYSRDFRYSPETGDTSKNDDIVEAGDAAWLNNKMRDKLLGGEVKINIPVPATLGNKKLYEKLIAKDTVTPEAKRLYEEKLASIEEATDIAALREAHLQGWWEKEAIYNEINKNELKCGMLGDAVYMVYWDEEEGCPEVESYDPGFCFPYEYGMENLDESWEEVAEGVEPIQNVLERFVLAWQEECDSTEYYRIYKEVYELRVMPDGSKKCFKHSAYYNVTAKVGMSFEDFSDEDIDGDNVAWEDIGIDFIPFVWVANIEEEGEEPYGKSNIHYLIGILDNMMNAYSDLNTNSEYLGGAVLGLSGKDLRPKRDSATGEPIGIDVQPRAAYWLGEDGKMSLMDTSRMQEALLSTIKAQDARFLRNACVPEVIAGKIESGNIPSGVALAIMLQPLIDKITPMRQQRQKKYAQLFDMVQKLYAKNGDDYEKTIFAGETFQVKLHFGALIPTDRKAMDDHYTALRNVLSEETVLEIMKEDGIAIDVQGELLKKEEESTKALEKQQALFQSQSRI